MFLPLLISYDINFLCNSKITDSLLLRSTSRSLLPGVFSLMGKCVAVTWLDLHLAGLRIIILVYSVIDTFLTNYQNCFSVRFMGERAIHKTLDNELCHFGSQLDTQKGIFLACEPYPTGLFYSLI